MGLALPPLFTKAVLLRYAFTPSFKLMPPRSHSISSIPVFSTITSYREWRGAAQNQGKSVGFVPTMGALHQGHLSLVKHSLRENDLTVVSIFVNPAQFAPHEDLDSYPRTLPSDLASLSRTSIDPPGVNAGIAPRIADAVFAPSVAEMYPNGIERNTSSQKGTFVEVKGYSHQMEGSSRPDFFRGVATVVTKLFHVIQPTAAYFGQKDIQQAFLLRRLCADLLFSHPTAQKVHIVATARAPSGLALSSRNSYLHESELPFAITLFDALKEGETAWMAGLSRDEVIKRAVQVVERRREEAEASAVKLKLDYVQVTDPETFENAEEGNNRPAIVSGALWVGRTRLIDNILLGNHVGILH